MFDSYNGRDDYFRSDSGRLLTLSPQETRGLEEIARTATSLDSSKKIDIVYIHGRPVELMSYERFEALLESKLSLNRVFHYAKPSEKPKLRKTIDALDIRLQSCPLYKQFMQHYARIARKVG